MRISPESSAKDRGGGTHWHSLRGNSSPMKIPYWMAVNASEYVVLAQA